MAQKTDDRWSPWLETLGVTREEISAMYRKWYDDVYQAMKEEKVDKPRQETIAFLMKSLYASEASVVRYIRPGTEATGEFLSLLCHRLEKAQAANPKAHPLEVDLGNPDLKLHIRELQAQGYSEEAQRQKRVAANLQAVRQAQVRKEAELAEKEKEVVQTMQTIETAKERTAAEREELARERRDVEALKNRETRLKVLFEECHPGGRLYETENMSLERKVWQIKAEHWRSIKSYADSGMADEKQVELEQKERTLAMIVWPLRQLVYRRTPR